VWIDKYKVIRRLLLLWTAWELHWTIHYVFTKQPVIAASTVTALSLVVGMLATVIGLYKWRRFDQDKKPK